MADGNLTTSIITVNVHGLKLKGKGKKTRKEYEEDVGKSKKKPNKCVIKVVPEEEEKENGTQLEFE